MFKKLTRKKEKETVEWETENSKMADLSPNTSVTTLNVNDLNMPEIDRMD